MKLGLRIAIFVVGVELLLFGWHRAHNDSVTQQNPTSTTPAGSSEILVTIGGFVMLMAFAPTQDTLGRWMALKRPKKSQPAHFKRRQPRRN